MNEIVRQWIGLAAASAATASPEAIAAASPDATAVPGWGGILLGISGVLALIGSKLWDAYSKRSSTAAQGAADVTATGTITRQENRIAILEGKIEAFETRLTTEQELRRSYQDKYATLRMRVGQLEQILRDHDIPVPPIDHIDSGG